MKNSKKKCLLKGISRTNKVNARVVDRLTTSRKALVFFKKNDLLKNIEKFSMENSRKTKKEEK